MSDVINAQAGRHWMLLIYRFGAAERARFRGAVWRRLRVLGAVYLQDGVAVLPGSTHSEQSLRILRHDILERSGSAVLLGCKALAGEPLVLAAFKTARDSEYEEIMNTCRAFLGQILSDHQDQRYSFFATLKESEANLDKLRNQLSKGRRTRRSGRRRPRRRRGGAAGMHEGPGCVRGHRVQEGCR